MTQTSLFDLPAPKPVSRVPIEDRERMQSLKWRLFQLMLAYGPNRWWTLRELSDRTEGLQTSVSMRLREIRAEKPEGYTVEKVNRGGGLWEYRLVPVTE